MPRPKINSYNEFDNEKKFLRLKNSPPPPPHKFSNGPSLNRFETIALLKEDSAFMPLSTQEFIKMTPKVTLHYLK